MGENHTTVNGYVTGLNSHDLTTGLKWGLTNDTICCANDFSRVSHELKNTMRHTANMRAKIDESLRKIELVQEEQQTMFDTFIKLAQIPVTKEHIAKVVNKVTTVDITKTNEQVQKDYSTYARNRSTELLTSISKEMSYKGQTLWGLFSGVTHYTTHVAPAPKREDGRKESKYAGSAAKIDNEAYALITSF